MCFAPLSVQIRFARKAENPLAVFCTSKIGNPFLMLARRLSIATPRWNEASPCRVCPTQRAKNSVGSRRNLRPSGPKGLPAIHNLKGTESSLRSNITAAGETRLGRSAVGTGG